MLSVRTAEAGDLPSLLRLIEAYWDFEGLPGFDAARVDEDLARLESDARLGQCWIAESEGRPVGYLIVVYVFSLEHHGLTAEVDELFVSEDYRAQNAGSMRLGHAERHAAAAGCTNISLRVGADNGRAARFYARHGYARADRYHILEKRLPDG